MSCWTFNLYEAMKYVHILCLACCGRPLAACFYGVWKLLAASCNFFEHLGMQLQHPHRKRGYSTLQTPKTAPQFSAYVRVALSLPKSSLSIGT
jgi:hypothetical protein